MNHEEQHQELLFTDFKWTLGHNPLFPVYKKTESKAVNQIAELEFIPIPEGVYEIGHEGNEFSFDNELGKHKVYLNPYKIANRLITNGEYLEFIQAGGYQNFEYWLSEGWAWVNKDQITSPEYWHKIDDEWYEYTLGRGFEKINNTTPVTHISYFEADAFARWKGKRLPTEFEWEIAAKEMAGNNELSNFMEKKCFHPRPKVPENNQFFGDVWEWTSSAYLPYPGFKKADGAVGEYNGKFMINQMVLRGGSCVTPQNHIRLTYRNFFHTEKRWQFTGIRLAE